MAQGLRRTEPPAFVPEPESDSRCQTPAVGLRQNDTKLSKSLERGDILSNLQFQLRNRTVPHQSAARYSSERKSAAARISSLTLSKKKGTPSSTDISPTKRASTEAAKDDGSDSDDGYDSTDEANDNYLVMGRQTLRHMSDAFVEVSKEEGKSPTAPISTTPQDYSLPTPGGTSTDRR